MGKGGLLCKEGICSFRSKVLSIKSCSPLKVEEKKKIAGLLPLKVQPFTLRSIDALLGTSPYLESGCQCGGGPTVGKNLQARVIFL